MWEMEFPLFSQCQCFNKFLFHLFNFQVHFFRRRGITIQRCHTLLPDETSYQLSSFVTNLSLTSQYRHSSTYQRQARGLKYAPLTTVKQRNTTQKKLRTYSGVDMYEACNFICIHYCSSYLKFGKVIYNQATRNYDKILPVFNQSVF